jgi:hypothetical protein
LEFSVFKKVSGCFGFGVRLPSWSPRASLR